MRAQFCWCLGISVLAPCGRGAAQSPSPPPAIADNSFLLEEAYNQEQGVVQHISVWQRGLRSAAWAFSFTQEWPLGGPLHQLSYTVPIERTESPSRTTGFGDVALNYRLQLRPAEHAVAVAPRVSLLLPTGSEARGLGSGAVAAQLNLPVSARLGSSVVSHWNAGLTAVSENTIYSLGASVIWLVRPTLNVMFEVAWADQSGGGAESFVVNPGIRWAHNFASGLQIVPGVAFPVGVGPSRGERSALVYLSFEHRFRPETRRN